MAILAWFVVGLGMITSGAPTPRTTAEAAALRTPSAPARAKSVAHFTREVWRIEEGLPQNSINAIAKTHDGYMWLATFDGLVRFDGTQFTVFDPRTAKEMVTGRIGDLFADQTGRLWIFPEAHAPALRYHNGAFTVMPALAGMTAHEASSFGRNANFHEAPDGSLWWSKDGGITRFHEGRFTTYTVKDGLTSPSVGSILPDSRGGLWVATERGLARFTNGRFTTYATADGLPSDVIGPLCIDLEGNLWIGTSRGLVQRWHDRFITYTMNDGLPANDIKDVFADIRGDLWLRAGGWLLRRSHGTFTREIRLEGNPPLRIAEDRKGGNLWIQTSDTALALFRDGKRVPYTTNTELSSKSIYSLYADVEGSLWIGRGGGGLERLKPAAVTTYTKRDGLLQDEILCVLETSDGSIWIGTNGGGLSRLRQGRVTNYTTREGLPANAVWSLAEDRAGTLWIGTEKGLTSLKRDTIREVSLPRIWISSIHEDRHGALWVGTGQGLYRYAGGASDHYTTRDGLVNNVVRAIHEDPAGALWLATDGGVTRMMDGALASYTIRDGLSDSFVRSIYQDADGTLWFGTYGNGFTRFRNGVFTRYTTNDGLFDHTASRILGDGQGYLWMTGNKGISRLSKKDLNDFAVGKIASLTPSLYGTEQGLENVECNGGSQPAGWKTRDGRLWFPTMGGLATIDPGRLDHNSYVPPVVIEEITINGKRAAQREGIRVPPGPGTLEVRYAGLSFFAPRMVRFKYQLEGFDTGWVDAGTRRAAYYTNVPPGRYRFRVIAANNDGIWNDRGASIAIELQPHFYQTLWFYGACLFLATAVAAAAYAVRVRGLKARERELTTRVNQRTEQLKEAKGAAEAAARSKSEFLANMSHEIRTPLNGVTGMLELARHTALTPEQQDILGMAQDSAAALLVVINDILDFSKIEAGKLQFEAASFDLAEIVAEAARTLAVRAAQKRLELAYGLAPEVPALVTGDPARLKQVLMNLVGNAVKFTDQGEIILRVEKSADTHDGVELTFSVSDTGIGIPVEQRASIFEAFSQADSSVTRKFGGTGLGLAICARIVTLMGGRIWVESEVGRGSRFSFTATFTHASTHAPVDSRAIRPTAGLTAGPTVSPAVRIDARTSLCGRRALIVDDNRTNLLTLRQMLASWGMEPVMAANGREALDILSATPASDRPFDLLIADCTMPEMDGPALVEAVTRWQGPMPRIIMMATPDHYEAVSQRRELGLASCLIKPVKPSELMAAIRAALADRASRARPAPGANGRQPSAVALTILLAEDNQINRTLAVKMLEKLGHAVVVASNGREAVEQIQRGSFDMVLMDVHMPEVDGLAATRAIRRWEVESGARIGGARIPSQRIPIVAMTASAMKDDEDACLRAGMDAFLTKPISLQALDAITRRAAPSPTTDTEERTPTVVPG